MLHSSTQKLLLKLHEMTMDGAIAWKEADDDAVKLVTEGYCVLVKAEPPLMELSTAKGRILESATEDVLRQTPMGDDDERTFIDLINDIGREGSRYARGTEQAINAILGAAASGVLSKGLDDPVALSSEDDTTVGMDTPESAAMAQAVGDLAERLNASPSEQAEPVISFAPPVEQLVEGAQTLSDNQAPHVTEASEFTDGAVIPSAAPVMVTEASSSQNAQTDQVEASQVDEAAEPPTAPFETAGPTTASNSSASDSVDVSAIEGAFSNSAESVQADNENEPTQAPEPAHHQPVITVHAAGAENSFSGLDAQAEEENQQSIESAQHSNTESPDFLLSAEAAAASTDPQITDDVQSDPEAAIETETETQDVEAPVSEQAYQSSEKLAPPEPIQLATQPPNSTIPAPPAAPFVDAGGHVPTAPSMPVRSAHSTSPSPVGFQQPVFEPKGGGQERPGDGLKKVTALGIALGRNAAGQATQGESDSSDQDSSQSQNGNGAYKPWG